MGRRKKIDDDEPVQKRQPKPGNTRYRRTEEELIKDLEAKIAELHRKAQLKTLKTRPEFPDRFRSLDHARAVCGDILQGYNREPHHVGLGLLTPHDVHYGLAE